MLINLEQILDKSLLDLVNKNKIDNAEMVSYFENLSLSDEKFLPSKDEGKMVFVVDLKKTFWTYSGLFSYDNTDNSFGVLNNNFTLSRNLDGGNSFNASLSDEETLFFALTEYGFTLFNNYGKTMTLLWHEVADISIMNDEVLIFSKNATSIPFPYVIRETIPALVKHFNLEEGISITVNDGPHPKAINISESVLSNSTILSEYNLDDFCWNSLDDLNDEEFKSFIYSTSLKSLIKVYDLSPKAVEKVNIEFKTGIKYIHSLAEGDPPIDDINFEETDLDENGKRLFFLFGRTPKLGVFENGIALFTHGYTWWSEYKDIKAKFALDINMEEYVLSKIIVKTNNGNGWIALSDVIFNKETGLFINEYVFPIPALLFKEILKIEEQYCFFRFATLRYGNKADAVNNVESSPNNHDFEAGDICKSCGGMSEESVRIYPDEKLSQNIISCPCGKNFKIASPLRDVGGAIRTFNKKEFDEFIKGGGLNENN